MEQAGVARGLVAAETFLRARGLTGAQALDALVAGLRHRLLGEPADPVAQEAAARVPLTPGTDLIGLAYERFFPDLFKGAVGQFFTPEPVVRLLVGRLDLRPGEDVLDPTCGAGGLLVGAGRAGARVRGIELDPRLSELAALHLRLAGVEGAVRRADFFTAVPEPADVVVANPPFSVPIDDPAALARHGIDSPRAASEAVFLAALAAWVRPGGRAAVVVPWSVVANGSAASLRARLAADFALRAVCALPEGVFRPFGGAAGRAGVLWLDRRPAAARPTAWARVEDPGYDVRSRSLKPTRADEIDRLLRGEGWSPLPTGAWVPAGEVWSAPTRPLAELAVLEHALVRPSREPDALVGVVDLADADRGTGEVPERPPVRGAEVSGARLALGAERVLVARMRPELGNVAVLAPRSDGVPVVGSPEWVVLASPWPRFLGHALRTPAWRRRLPVRTGQTRPRVDAAAILDTEVPWPGEAVAARVDAVSQALRSRRAALLAELVTLQGAVDAFAEGQGSAAALDAIAAAIAARLGLGPLEGA